MTFRVLIAAWLVTSVSALSPTTSLAQGIQTSAVRGFVEDPQGLPVPGVTVTATSSALQGQRTATTEADGSYQLAQLPAGIYQLRFERQGFSPLTSAITVSLGGHTEQHVALEPAGVTRTVDVVATATPLREAPVGLNIRQDEVEALATSRTLHGIATLSPGLNEQTPESGQVSINGAPAFDNAFMLNGVDINDNLSGSPQNLFIEDAIEETQVLTSGLPSEFGHFSGGVVNAITRSGGNAFSGSLRLNLTNPSWTQETPFEREAGLEREPMLNETYELTVGGPIARDRVWFFGAGRRASVTSSETLDQVGLPYSRLTENWRGEAKATATPVANHVLSGGYLNNHLRIDNSPGFPFSIDPATLVDQTLPNWYAFGTYRGILRRRVLVEAQTSHRAFRFDGSGGTSRAMADSPFITLTQALGHYNAPYFDATDPEERNNRQITGNVTYFAHGAGRHEVKGGYEWFRSQRVGGNSQSATNYVFDADYLEAPDGSPLLDADGRLIPVFRQDETLIEHWMATRGATLNVDTHSFYAQDRWQISRQASANLGLRYERVRSTTTGGLVGIDTHRIVPRLSFAYDVAGTGAAVLGASYGHYSGRYNEAQIGANTNVGNPDMVLGFYTGPDGQGRTFAPGLDPANYEIFYGEFPTLNVFVEDGLSSPITKELTFSAGTTAGPRAFLEATYVWRRTSGLIEDFIDTTNGFTDVSREGIDFGTFTNIVYRNTDLAVRKYQAAILQGRYAVRNNLTAHGAWTVQLQNHGNYEGEAVSQPGLPSVIGDFPEALDPDRHYPMGRLATFQRHRARLWAIYTMDAGRAGNVSVSGLVRIESGPAYSYVATGVPLTATQAALLEDYPDGPARQSLYFGARGSETFPAYGLLDVSVNYTVPVVRSLRPWLKFDVFNLLDHDALVRFDTTIAPDFSGPVDALGLPTQYIRGPAFGTAVGTGSYPRSLGASGGRTARIALGVRF